jgi:hypothetical protein
MNDARKKELEEWRATLSEEETEELDRIIRHRGEDYVLSILGHLKSQVEYVRSL